MGFAKTLKMWSVFRNTASMQAFIKEAAKVVDPKTDPMLLRAVWHAFECASEHAAPKAATKAAPKVAVKTPPPKATPAVPKRAAAATVAPTPSRHRERLNDRPAPKRTVGKRGRR